jgi:O-ureido-D-serine cyclo-ligase
MLALTTAAAARALDEDLAPLCAALAARGIDHQVVDWDDAAVDWRRYRAAILRSTWDYIDRFDEFNAWIDRVQCLTRLLNPPDVVRWNTHKGYLLQLSERGVPIVPTTLVRVGEDIVLPAVDELVVKPAVGAGSRGARRFCRDLPGAMAHAQALLAEGRDVLLQPYLTRVDQAGETALMYFGGRYSHAIRKGPLLAPDAEATAALFAPEQIIAREPGADERELAARVLAALPFAEPLLYARVDLLRDEDGSPVLLELELTEPSLFFAYAQGSVERYVDTLLAMLKN